MNTQPSDQRESPSASSSNSSKQSFCMAPSQPANRSTPSSNLEREEPSHDSNPQNREGGNKSILLPQSRSQPSPSSPDSGPPQIWHSAISNPVLSGNPGYQSLGLLSQGETEFDAPQRHEESDEPICFCLHPAATKTIFNLASLMRAGASSIIKYASIGANWVPPAPSDSDIESDFDDEDGLEELRRRKGARKWNGPPQPVFVPAGGFTLTSRSWEERSSRNNEGRDNHDVSGGSGRSKRWKGKGKAVDVEERSNGYSRSDHGGRGKLRAGAYVPAEPDRRGTTWYPKGANLGEE